MLIFHQALNQVFQILKKVHRHANSSPLSQRAFPKPPHAGFHNLKTLWGKLVRSKLKTCILADEEKGNFECGGRSNCQICGIFKKSNEIRDLPNGNDINSSFHCNILRVKYPLGSMLAPQSPN